MNRESGKRGGHPCRHGLLVGLCFYDACPIGQAPQVRQSMPCASMNRLTRPWLARSSMALEDRTHISSPATRVV